MQTLTRRGWACRIGLFGLILLASAPMAHGQCRLGWKFGPQQGLPGVSRTARAAVTFDDGSGEALYVDVFQPNVAGAVRAIGVARWDGRTWSAVGNLVKADVQAMTVYNGQLIAGGWFTLASGQDAQVIRWDGQRWVSMSDGLGAVVGALVTFEGRLILSHVITNTGLHPEPIPVHWIYEWDGQRWNEMGARPSSYAYGFIVYKGALYARMYRGQDPTSWLARWSGRVWESIGEAGLFRTFAVFDGKLVLGGISNAGGRRYSQIAAWDGTRWTDMSRSIPGDVYGLFEFEGRLYAAGKDKQRPPFGSPGFVATWDGRVWRQVGDGQLSGSPRTMGAFGGAVVVSGVMAQGQGAFGLARFDGTDWQPLGGGFDDKILRFGVHNNQLFAAGAFGQAGAFGGVGGVARWDGSAWQGVGAAGADGEVLEFVTFGSDLFVVGKFTEIGGLPANYIARWDGAAWSAIGSGANAPILGATVFNGELVVVGEFTSIDGVSAQRIARWDGQNWRQFGPGFSDTASVAYAFGGELFVGGDFVFSQTGTLLNHMARWDGQQWQEMQRGTRGRPLRIASYRGDIVVLSRFAWSFYGPWSVSGWDGFNWYKIGEVPSGLIFDLATYNGELYITGDFIYVTNTLIPAQRIARWDGVQWRSVGDGLGPPGVAGSYPQSHALAVYNDALIVGGDFIEVSGQVSAHWARWGCVSCYADCDSSTGAGVLDVFDYLCFQSSFIAGDPYACDCDTATGPGVCDMFDFLCFVDQFALGCP